MKLSFVLLSATLLLTSFACKREDGPLSPEADRIKKPATGNNNSNPGHSNPGEGDGDGLGEGPIEKPIDEPTDTRRMPLVEESWAHAAAATLQSYFNNTTSLYRDTPEVSAHALGSLIDFMRLSGSREYLHVVNKVFEANKSGSFLGPNFFTNSLWATTWIKAYDLVGDKRYLEMAKTIADDMDAEGWDATICGGGVNATRTLATKLAASTLAYIQLNGALHNRVEGSSPYLDRAGKAWVWFMASGMFNKADSANNGLNSQCKNDGSRTWSHSQGLLIAAAMELNKASPKAEYLDVAKRVAASVMKNMVSEGILREANDSSCNDCLGEERIYKGIFMRSLREAQDVWKDPSIDKFLEANIVKLWSGSRSTSDSLGFHWQSAFDSRDAGRQAAALDLLNAGLHKAEHENAALNRVAYTTVNCAPDEAGAQAVDGSTLTKWCSAVSDTSGASLIIDLGEETELNTIKILHGASGGENLDTNTRDYTLSIGASTSGPWAEIARAQDNTSTATFHHVKDLSSKFLRLHITKGGADGIARIYEVTVE